MQQQYQTSHDSLSKRMADSFSEQSSLMGYSDSVNNKNCCYVTWVMILCAAFIAGPYIFSGYAIKYSKEAANSKCYQHENIITLSNYVLISSWVSIGLMTSGIVAVIVFTLCSGSNGPNACALLVLTPVILASLLYGVYSLAMAIIGAIELARSYPKCEEEANTLCIFAIIIVILHFIGLCCGGSGVKYGRKNSN